MAKHSQSVPIFREKRERGQRKKTKAKNETPKTKKSSQFSKHNNKKKSIKKRRDAFMMPLRSYDIGASKIFFHEKKPNSKRNIKRTEVFVVQSAAV